MCGILGIYQNQKINTQQIQQVEKGLEKLKSRGPNQHGIFQNESTVLGHNRLSVIDTSIAGKQPMSDDLGNYQIVYNGEFYNYKQEREILIKKGYQFNTQTDTEVLLYMYIAYGISFLKRINGCFALAIYNRKENEILIARDRFGIKPLYYSLENKCLKFASELKGLLPLLEEKKLNMYSLQLYFQFNYIPDQQSIIANVQQLSPASYLLFKNTSVEINKYYQIDYKPHEYSNISYEDAQSKTKELLEKAVQKRLLADVPLGTFLSGGIDSSIISYIASKHLSSLDTFSIGYSDEAFFDETSYAEHVAKKIGSHHHSFRLSNKDLYEHLFQILDYIDEPFADSSAIPVYILSKLTKSKLTVALSGDGADEIFSGYNKHQAHYDVLNGGLKEQLIKNFGGIATILPQSRNGKWSNRIRQIAKYYQGISMSDKERYLHWASILPFSQTTKLLKTSLSIDIIKERTQELTKNINKDFNDILYSDVQMVLTNDMLYKVDRMSMANSLEVRTPFLDHELVDFVFSLPAEYKINKRFKKRLLQDSYKNFLSPKLYRREKHGFEVPLKKWFQNELYSYIFDDLLEPKKIEAQGILNIQEIAKYKLRLSQMQSGDITSTIWALIVFQHWYDRFLNDNI